MIDDIYIIATAKSIWTKIDYNIAWTAQIHSPTKSTVAFPRKTFILIIVQINKHYLIRMS